MYCASMRILMGIRTKRMADLMGYSKATLEKYEHTYGEGIMPSTRKRFEIIYTQAIDKLIKESTKEQKESYALFDEEFVKHNPKEA